MSTSLNKIRKAKYFLFKYKIHNFLPSYKLNFLGHLSAVSKWIAEHREVKYSDFPVKAFDFKRRLDLYQFLVEEEIKGEEIDYLEFGVFKGSSFKWWINNIKNENSSFFGFDTFTGLPEDWGHFKKGDLSSGNELPIINDTRHKFFQGIFQQTLYVFLKSYVGGKKKVIHLDADLYSSTLFVLTTISPYLKKGDIIIFDEFNVPLHEFKAFSEWVKAFYINYSVVAEVNNYFQVAIKIE